MKNLETLINELCPDGVEFVKLSQHCEIYDGTHQTPKYQESGIPFISVENIKSIYGSKKYISQEAYDAYKIKPQVGDVFMTRIGSIGACAVFTQKADIAYYVSLALLRPNSKVLNSGFLKYIIESSWGEKELRKRTLVNAVPIKVNKQDIGKIEIPLPPIEVQNEIVRILDKFTELEAELEAELDCRKRQYEYYRDKLLSFENVGGQNVEWKKMSEVIYSINTGLNPRRFFRLNTNDAHNYYVTIKEMKNGNIVFNDDTDMINDDALKLCNNRSHLEKGDLIFSGTGTIGQIVVLKETPTNWNIKEGLYSLKPIKEKIDSKYMAYILNETSIRKTYMKKALGGTVKSVPMKVLTNIKIPIPPLAEQERIVSILDRFESLTTSLTAGLPAEIAARRQQYEHYRDKLLTFKRKTA